MAAPPSCPNCQKALRGRHSVKRIALMGLIGRMADGKWQVADSKFPIANGGPWGDGTDSILFDAVKARGFGTIGHGEGVQRRGRANGGCGRKDESLAQIGSVL